MMMDSAWASSSPTAAADDDDNLVLMGSAEDCSSRGLVGVGVPPLLLVKKEEEEDPFGTSVGNSSSSPNHHHHLCSPAMSPTTTTTLHAELDFVGGGGFVTPPPPAGDVIVVKSDVLCSSASSFSSANGGGLLVVGSSSMSSSSSSSLRRHHHQQPQQPTTYDEQQRSCCSPDSPDRHFCSSTTQNNNGGGQHLQQQHQQVNHRSLDTSGVDDGVVAGSGGGPKRICLVCGDVASGFHYGVASCEACKAFFKRTIQGNIEYTCPASNDCEINKRRRKACQACRFQKCLRMGMLKEGVRLDRVRGGRQKYRRSNSDMPYPPHNLTPPKKPTLEDNKVLMALLGSESSQSVPPLLLPQQQQQQMNSEEQSEPGAGGPPPPPGVSVVSLLSELYDREIVSTIGWAKHVPGFVELSLNDQMRLLQATWAEILTLSIAFRSLALGGRALAFAPDFLLDEKQARDAGVASELFSPVVQVVDRLDRLGVTKEEFCLLKALVLVNADTRIEDAASVKKLREAIVAALADSVAVLRPSCPSVLGWVSGLLLCLPSLRQSDVLMKRFWVATRREGKVTMNKLLVEMLEAHFR